ncbi:MAG: hypothetical protein WB767_17980 [Nocardioides sp.]
MDLQIGRPGVVVPVRVDPTGALGPTPDQARGRRWRRTSPGRYVPASVAGDPLDRVDQRIVEVAAGLPPGTGVTGWAALHWQGARYLDVTRADGGLRDVDAALGDAASIAPRRGVVLSYDWLFADDVGEVDGLPITRPERSVSYAARRARTLEQAVRVIDMAAAADLVDLASLGRYAERLTGRSGVRRLMAAIDAADENVWSPMEVTMRLRWTDRGYPRPLCNAPIFDRNGRHLLTPDPFDPTTGVVGEYDGVVHDLTRVRRRDLDREELCRDHGLERVSMIAADLSSSTFERRLDSAYQRARGRQTRGGWTLEQPAWWVDTTSVARRRQLSIEQRRRWLAHLAG